MILNFKMDFTSHMRATSRNRNIIFIALSITFIGVVGAFYIYLKNIDERYTVLISKKTETLQILQKLTAQSNTSFFMLYNILHTSDVNEIENLKIERKYINKQNTAYLESMAKCDMIDADALSDYKSLLATRKDYTKHTCFLLKNMQHQPNKTSLQYFNAEVVPCFNKYQNELNNFVTQNKIGADQLSNALSKETKSITAYLVVIGLTPLIVYILFAFFNLFFINMMMWRLKDS